MEALSKNCSDETVPLSVESVQLLVIRHSSAGDVVKSELQGEGNRRLVEASMMATTGSYANRPRALEIAAAAASLAGLSPCDSGVKR